MKKIILKLLCSFIFAFVCLFAFACGGEKVNLNDVYNDLLDDVNLLAVTENLDLATTVGDVKVTWESSNETVISNAGVVTRQEKDVYVTLKVTLEYDGEKLEKEVKVKVLKVEKEETTLENVITCAEAKEIGLALSAGGETEEKYTVTGVVVEIANTIYGNLYISDDNGATKFYVYGVFDESGHRYDAMENKPEVGDTITVVDNIMNYNGTPEMSNATLLKLEKGEGNTGGENILPEGPNIGDNYDCITLEEAIKIAKEAGSAGTSEKYYIYGIVSKVSNATYGQMIITDGINSLSIYGTYSKDGVLRYSEMNERPVAGDEVVLYGSLKVFNDTPEMGSGWIQEFVHHKQEVDINDYKEVTIAEGREAEVDSKLIISGVVAKITYANGFNPNGFLIVDATGSIYVYGYDVTGQVREGNTVKVAGVKTYYVLDTEKANAEKFGYKGSCQLQDGILLENDNKTTDLNLTWVEENTVKGILDTPVTENITTNIYKVTAYVNKVPGSGFVNYYINDLDNVTGSYVYTSCNGADFSYLDEFDGKICDVYLTALNCKSTAAECFYRFIPVKVSVKEGFEFDVQNAPKFVVEYNVLDYIKDKYTADPALELIIKQSYEALGFKDVTVTYTSSNQNVVFFEVKEEVAILHTKDAGTATITITAKYNDYTYSKDVVITVESTKDYEAITVKQAVEAEKGSNVQVKGIVLASLVNQTGFYIGDETGIIAVRCGADVCAEVKVGDMIIVNGTRKNVKKEEAGEYAGQIAVDDAKLVANYYGNHAAPTNSYDSTKTLEELYNMDYTKDATAQVYVLNVKVEETGNAYYTNANLVSLDGKTTLGLYCSSAKQYSFLTAFKGQEVTVELALCNWNGKNYYRGCVLAVTVNGQRIVNELNFTN